MSSFNFSSYFTFLVLAAYLWIVSECLYSSEILEYVLLYLLPSAITKRKKENSLYGLKCVPLKFIW